METATSPATFAVGNDPRGSPMLAEVLRRLPGGAPRHLASAPGRLDVMGGIAEYTGALVLTMTTACHACVGVQPRVDGVVSITRLSAVESDTDGAIELSAQVLRAPDGTPIDAGRGGRLVQDNVNETVRCVLGVLVETVRDGLVSDWDDGISVVVRSNLSGLTDAGRNAAVAAGTLAASAHARGVTLESREAVDVCRRVQNEWLGLPIGGIEVACALLGEPYALAQFRGEPCTPAGSIPLPDDLTLVGVDSGVLRPDWKTRYERARTAAFMGRVLIDRIVRHEAGGDVPWDGYLAQVSAADYVERFRDRLPTRLKGSVFLERFGETGDPLTRIDPELTYRVRSRTEHHIYEHARACRFAECLSRFIREGDCGILDEAGELMYASHWSYGQRCGLGSVETDLLVNFLRRHRSDAEIYGAKISGRGCGGVVTVLMAATERAEAALHEAMEAYRAQTGRAPTLIRGSLAGSLVSGARRM